jgi:plasmid stability protein
MRAAEHGVSMEEEAREILKIAVANLDREQNFGDALHALFAPSGGVDLPEFPDEPVGDPISFDE